MRNLFVHPIPVVLLLLLVSMGVHPTSPSAERSDSPGLASATVSAGGDGGQEGPCWLSCYHIPCDEGWHWATTLGDRNRWDGGDHWDACRKKPCGSPPRGRHAFCTLGPGEDMAALDEAVLQGRADHLAQILAENEAVVLNSERRAIQVWSICTKGELGAHVPLPIDLFEAVVLAQQDALE